MLFGAKVKLSEVFGVLRDIPKYTYVDRQSLDRTFTHYLGSQKHIVVHGASKQGKSCLRRQNLDPNHTVVVQCLPNMTSDDDIWRAALENMSKSQLVSSTHMEQSDVSVGTEAAAEGGVPLLGKASGKFTGELSDSTNTTHESAPIRQGRHLPTLAAALKQENKRLVLEDFHYLPDDARKSVAFGLKALYEEGAYAVIIGIWSEQNLITFYNGDLTGRIEEINLTWSESELEQVLSKGEGALNITISSELRKQIIESCFRNVGLLQRLAEKVCIEAGVFESQDERIVISDISLLQRARAQIVNDIRQRYIRIADVFRYGMRVRDKAVLHIYARIYNELIDADETELMRGLAVNDLLGRMQRNARDGLIIRQSDLTQSLERIERLQSTRGITPLLLSFSNNLRQIFLNDREFLFYRKYSGDDPNDLKVDVDSIEDGEEEPDGR